LLTSGCADSQGAGPVGPRAASPAVIAPAAPIVVRSEPWSYADQPGKIFHTDHYRLFTTEQSPMLLERLPPFLEIALDAYTSDLADLPKPTLPLDTFLLAERWQWSRLTKQLMGEEADLYLRIGRGGFAADGRAILYTIGPHDTLAIAAHEGWHQFTQRTFKQRLPVWLEEGVAAYMEGFRPDPTAPGGRRMAPWANAERFDQLRNAHATGNLVSLEQLLTSTPGALIEVTTDGTLNYYAQVWALTHFLKEGEGGRYAQSLQRLLIDAAEGRLSKTVQARIGPQSMRLGAAVGVGPLIFFAYFERDLELADRQYQAFIADIVRVGAKDLIVQGESPVSR
jgi:hypothetical protein